LRDWATQELDGYYGSKDMPEYRVVQAAYLRPETLAAANARIVDFHAKLELAERWGGGEVASIDGLRFVVPRRTIHAAYNRRYFDRRRGVTGARHHGRPLRRAASRRHHRHATRRPVPPRRAT